MVCVHRNTMANLCWYSEKTYNLKSSQPLVTQMKSHGFIIKKVYHDEKQYDTHLDTISLVVTQTCHKL